MTASRHKFAELPSATALHSPDDASYDAFSFLDLVPQLSGQWPQPHPGHVPILNDSATQRLVGPDGLHASHCERDDWRTQLVGPFISYGGHDWWQLSWGGAGGVSTALLEAMPRGVMHINAYYLGPVSWRSDAISWQGGAAVGAPIHQHHVHVVPGRGMDPRLSTLRCAAGLGPCADPCIMAQAHGDTPQRCVGLDLQATGVFVVAEPLFLGATLNDVRPSTSAPLTWWYQVSVRWAKSNVEGASTADDGAASGRPLAVHFAIQPALLDARAGGLQSGGTLPVPSREESFIWWVGRMPREGQLLETAFHSHMLAFHAALLFAADAADRAANGRAAASQSAHDAATSRLVQRLGLDSFRPLRHGYDAIRTASIGIASNHALRNRLVRLAPSQLVCRATNPVPHDCSPPHCSNTTHALAWRRRRLAQGAAAATTGATDAVSPSEVNPPAMWVDASPQVRCLRDWRFQRGQGYVGVGFAGPTGLGYAPSAMVSMHFAFGFIFTPLEGGLDDVGKGSGRRSAPSAPLASSFTCELALGQLPDVRAGSLDATPPPFVRGPASQLVAPHAE